MGKKVDLTGQKFNRLNVIREASKQRGKGFGVLWVCKCECGNETTVDSRSIKHGNTKSCGCLEREVLMKRNTTHGQAFTGNKTAEYKAWMHMKSRCYNPNVERFKNYGGRGIEVCERWLQDFTYFFEDMGKKPEGKYSLHRIDENQNYCKENCMWATDYIQNRFKTNSVYLEYNGEKKIQNDWAAELKVKPSKIVYYRQKGWEFDKIYNFLKK